MFVVVLTVDFIWDPCKKCDRRTNYKKGRERWKVVLVLTMIFYKPCFSKVSDLFIIWKVVLISSSHKLFYW